MSWREILYLVRRNLIRMKLRVAMTSVGVLIGTAAVILLVSMGAGLQRTIQQQFGAIGELTEIQIYSPGRGGEFFGDSSSEREQLRLDDRAIRRLKELPGVVTVAPILNLRASATLRMNVMHSFAGIRGIDPKDQSFLGLKLESGMPRIGNWQAIIGKSVIENFRDPRTNTPIEEPPDLQGQTVQLVVFRVGEDGVPVERVIRLRVTGILEKTGGQNDYSIFLSMNDVLDINTWATGRRQNVRTEGYDEAIMKVSSPQRVLAAEQMVRSEGFQTYSMQSALRGVNQTFLVIQMVLGGIGAVALLVAGFGIANAMVMAIYERTREIGLMKAVGARNRDVMFIFLTEAGLIGFIGGFGGVIVGWLTGIAASFVAGAYLESLIAQSGGTSEELQGLIYTPWWLVLFAILFSGLVGVLSGVYPALRATHLDPVAALRYE